MESSQFKVKWSLSTKLMATVLGILSATIIFLTVASVVLLKKDKVAYIYDAQATACALAGREFAHATQGALDVLQDALVTTDPFKPIPPDTTLRLRGTQKIMPTLLTMQIGRYRHMINEFLPLVRADHEEALKTISLNEIDMNLMPFMLKNYGKTLAEQQKLFINLSRVGKPPLLGIMVLDRNATNAPEAGMAFGLLSLQRFQAGIPPNIGNLMIFNSLGDLLFHTEQTRQIAASAASAAEPKPLDAEKPAVDPIFEDSLKSKSNTGAKEYSLEGQNYLASYFKPGLNLVVASRVEQSKAMQATYTLIEKLVLFGIFAISFAIVLAMLFAKSITRPIQRLFNATAEVSEGRFDVKLPPSGRDEIGALSDAFTKMSSKISQLVKQMVKQVRVEQELAVASTVQANLLPEPKYADEKVTLKGHYQSASQCGGDWWGHFRIGNKTVVMIADAIGHGIPSALMTASIRGCVSTIERILRNEEDNLVDFSPKAIIELANTAVYHSGRKQINMTFFLAVIDHDKMEITFANAAHCPPWLVRKENGKTQAKLLMSSGPRLGDNEELGEIVEFTQTLQPNDLIFFYTDGLLEGTDAAKNQYGKKRARKLLESLYGKDEEAVISAIVKDFMAHNGTKPLDDDLTLVAAILKNKV